jgi:hypothetical protein
LKFPGFSRAHFGRATCFSASKYEFKFAQGEIMRKFVVLIVFVGLLTLPLLAQDKADVFGGYQYLRLSNLGGCPNGEGCGPDINANGWDASLTGYFNKWLGVTGDFSGSYKSNVTIDGVSVPISGRAYTYSGGPVLAFREGRINPFVHVLFGGIHVSASNDGTTVSQNGFASFFGGGVDLKLNRLLSVRGQFDWVYTHFGSAAFNDNVAYGESGNVRVATGVVIHF